MKKIISLLVINFFISFELSSQQFYFSEDFSNGINQFTVIDGDGDGYNWLSASHFAQGGIAASESWSPSAGQLNPDNWLISPAIDLTSASGLITLEWLVYALDQAWVNEYYTVYVANNNDTASLASSNIKNGYSFF